MKEKTFFEKREINCIKKLEKITDELPYYVFDFFVGIEPRTSPLTRLNYGHDLKIFYDFLLKKVFRDKKEPKEISISDIENLNTNDFEYFLSYLSNYENNGNFERCNESAKARKLSTLRTFFKYLYNKDAIKSNVTAKVEMPKLHEKEIIRLDRNEKIDEISDILYVVRTGEGLTKTQKTFHNATQKRDTAIIALFLGTGIRISELVGLNTDDLDLKTNSFVVTRKGGNRAVLYFNNEVKDAINDYLIYKESIQDINKDQTALFLSLKNQRISVRQVEELVKKYAQIVSPLKRITPHKLRSTFGTNLYKETHDIYMVADCLGHKDINTTRKHYAAITEDVRKKASTIVKLNKYDD